MRTYTYGPIKKVACSLTIAGYALLSSAACAGPGQTFAERPSAPLVDAAGPNSAAQASETAAPTSPTPPTSNDSDDPLPDTLRLGDRMLTLNGKGMCSWGIFDLYRGALYVERPTTEAAVLMEERQATSIRLLFVRNLSQRQMERAWEAGFTANFSGNELAALRPRIDRLKEVMTAVRRGDLMTFDLVPGERTTLRVGGELLETFEGDDFQRAFITLYVGDHPPDRGLRRAFLRGGD